MDEKKGDQLWDCFEPIFEGYDPDSSPFVWKYVYSKIYFEKDWEFWKEKMGFEKVESSEDLKKKVLDSLETYDIRKIACAGENCPKFGGETDFNFKEQKYNYFKKNIKDNDSKKLLEECRKRHHALENFSLMLRTGNLQCVKGRSLDRLDRFIWLLNGYFTKNKDIEHKVFTGARASDADKQILKDYLDSFCDGGTGDDQAIYRYCLAIYKMDNKYGWVDRMIENGKKDMAGDHIKEYLNLAMEYWDTKLKNYSDIYKVAYDEKIRRSKNAIDEIEDEIKRINRLKKS